MQCIDVHIAWKQTEINVRPGIMWMISCGAVNAFSPLPVKYIKYSSLVLFLVAHGVTREALYCDSLVSPCETIYCTHFASRA